MDEQLQQTLQAQLKDVHLPDAVGWWPLSPAWWLVIALSTLALVYLSYRLIQRNRKNHYRKIASHELQSHFGTWQKTADSSAYLQQANKLLKRCVVSFKPNAARLSGESWVATLQQYSTKILSDKTQAILAHSVYQAPVNTTDELDIETLHQELSQWIKQHKQEATINSQPEALDSRPEANNV